MSRSALSSRRYGLRHQVAELVRDRVSIRELFLRIVGDEQTRKCKQCNHIFQLEDAVTGDENQERTLACPICNAGGTSFQQEVGFTHTDSFLAEDESRAYQFMQLASNFISRMIIAAPMVGLEPAPNVPVQMLQTQPVERKWWYISVAVIAVTLVGLALVGSAVTTTTSVLNATSGKMVPQTQTLWQGKDATTIAILGVVLSIGALIVGPDFLQKLSGLKPESSEQKWSDWIQLKVGMGQNKKTGDTGCMRKYRGAIRVLRRIRDPALRMQWQQNLRAEFDGAFSEVMNRFDEAFRITLAQLDVGIVEVSRPAARGSRPRGGPPQPEESSA